MTAPLAETIARVEKETRDAAAHPAACISWPDTRLLLSCARRCEATAEASSQAIEGGRYFLGLMPLDAPAREWLIPLLNAASERDVLAKRVGELESLAERWEQQAFRENKSHGETSKKYQDARDRLQAIADMFSVGGLLPELFVDRIRAESTRLRLEKTELKSEIEILYADIDRLRAENERLRETEQTWYHNATAAESELIAAQDRVRELENKRKAAVVVLGDTGTDPRSRIHLAAFLLMDIPGKAVPITAPTQGAGTTGGES